MTTVRMWLGTYPTTDDDGAPSGVRRVDLLDDGTLVDRGEAAALPHASWVAPHPSGRTLWATSETEDGVVVAYDVAGDALTEVARVPAGGDHPCHLTTITGPRDGALLVSCYGTGTLTVVPLDADGRPTGDGVTHVHLGSGPDADRQEGAHVHSAWELPDGAAAWVADLGTDEVRRYTLRPDGPAGDVTVAADGVAWHAPAGSGPRHVALHPDGVAYVAGELDSTVSVVTVDTDGSGTLVSTVPACRTAPDERGSFPGHVSLSPDGTRLHVGVRGPDVLATFAVEPDADGRPTVLRHLADTPLGARWPRHHALVGSEDGTDLVVVASQGDACLVVVRVAADGTGEVVGRLDLPVKPSCVVVA